MNVADLRHAQGRALVVVDTRDLPPVTPASLYPGHVMSFSPPSTLVIPGYEPFPWIRALLAVEREA